jgi:hypothetical protein
VARLQKRRAFFNLYPRAVDIPATYGYNPIQ